MAMQFWGVEVKGKESCKVHVEEGSVIHLSQATLGELKKDADPVILNIKVDDSKLGVDKKLVLGILTHGNNPQLQFDLVFDTDFEISHNWKNGSVHFLGYQSEMPDDEEEFDDFSDEEEEDVPVPQQNGKVAAATAAKVAAKLIKNKAKPEEVSVDGSEDSDEDEEDSDDDSEAAEDMMSLGEDDSDDEDDSDEEEEEPAKPAESGKKRTKPEAKTKSPEAKKSKLATPQKTADKKKGGHDATPHPSKKGAKSPGSNKSPKSGGSVSCGACTKTFNSEVALQSHSKAKHSAK